MQSVKPIKRCFVLMPFAPEFKQVFDHGISPAAEEAGFECFRADQPVGPRNIVREIVEYIFEADVVIADLSQKNPNVFYELGLTHAIANKTIMICERTGERLPFDLASYRTIFYDRSIDGIQQKLKQELLRTLQDFEQWTAKPTNPIQDFRPVYYTVPLARQAGLEEKIRSLEAEVSNLRSKSSGRPTIGKMVLIPSGPFLMGCGSQLGEGEELVREVSTSAFLMDIYPVTNGQFKQFVDEVPSWRKEDAIRRHGNVYYMLAWRGSEYPKGKRDHPVVWLNWYAAVAFCNWRSRSEGLSPCYSQDPIECDFSVNGYRLPTEAEYEKAARGGLTNKLYPWGDRLDEALANFGNIVGETSTVGGYPQNSFGLYDIVGNVKQWCGDWYSDDYYMHSAKEDPRGAESGEFKVFRGGGWAGTLEELRCGYRSWLLPPNTNPDLGFRCVRVP